MSIRRVFRPLGNRRGAVAAMLLASAVLLAAGCGGGSGNGPAGTGSAGAGETGLAAAAGGSGGKAQSGSLGGDVAKGKEIFMNTCASCHGADARGMPGLGKDWTTSEFIASQTDEQLLEFIKKGRPATDPANTTGVDMPPKGGNPSLTDEDLINVIAFMRSVNKVKK